MEMPAPDPATIARRDEIAASLRAIVPGEGVIVSEPERRAYESDGLTAYHQPPLVVEWLPRVEQRWMAEHKQHQRQKHRPQPPYPPKISQR